MLSTPTSGSGSDPDPDPDPGSRKPGKGKGKRKVSGNARKASDPSEAEVLKKCLEENKGDRTKCKSQIRAFKSATSSPPPPKPPSNSRFLRRGSLTDV